ncbi:LANO_0G16754g1_1 [Lachancea nothofagi CBS 11611]|uniref:Inositol-pentakisphosphate 2-kinase n=1 Tax=Lachancea nothofagi CBS 11611 TaxID=1266666 RepID=A0A1G4KKT6_9SACH|nr:LANO_0G16754g1_1 [Lachancea nothofagi CBS 11611]
MSISGVSVAAEPAKLVHKGNANILIRFNDFTRLERCCVRFQSLNRNNIYTLENYQYLEREVTPLLGDYLVRTRKVARNVQLLDLLLEEFRVSRDCSEVFVLEMENLTFGMDSVLSVDHFTKIHKCSSSTAVVWEFKPKWWCETGHICRNCTLNNVKGRRIPYCYNMILAEPGLLRLWLAEYRLPSQFFTDMELYLRSSGNVLAKLYEIQAKLTHSVPKLGDLNGEVDVSETLALLMAMRDVSCFIKWDHENPIRAKIVDVDLKPKSKWAQWMSQQSVLDESNMKVSH